MLRRAGFFVWILAGALLVPTLGIAADVAVGGKGPRVRTPDGRWLSNAGRPVFVMADDYADFGDLETKTAPPLRIEVKGDVEIVPTADGGVRIRFLDE